MFCVCGVCVVGKVEAANLRKWVVFGSRCSVLYVGICTCKFALSIRRQYKKIHGAVQNVQCGKSGGRRGDIVGCG
jgi:hypothetical protein